MSNYITEAFKQLNLLESEDISLDASGITELRSFLDDAAVDPDEEMMDIYDLKAEAEEDLAKSYEGKVVLECTVCHSHIFEDKENISMDEEGEACKDIECPYCMSNEGYFILGEISPFNQEEADSFAEDDELDEVDIEGAADEVNDEDIIEESCDTKKLKEDWDEEFESEYDSIVNDESLSKKEKDDAISKLFSDYGMNESMKLDGVEELYDNDEIRGVEELEGVDKLEGVEELHGEKHEAPINEGLEDLSSKELVELFLKYHDDYDNYKNNEAGFNSMYNILSKYGNQDEEVDTVFLRAPYSEQIEMVQLIEPNNLNESIEDVSVTTEDETMTMTTKEDGGVVIETMPKEEEFEAESDEEMIVPISDESSEVIDAATDALDSEDGEDFEAIKDEMENSEEEIGEEDFEDFDEESFNGLGESYLRNCYENVKSFKTTDVSSKNNKLFIEGVIKFDSGNIKETQFVFESLGNGKFEGYNKQISRGKKTYKLSGSVKDNKLVCESLNYNYRSKNELNESVRVYGTVKRK